MLVSALRFVSLFLTALATGTVFSQMVEGLGRSELVSAVWLAVQQVLYSGFGLVSGTLEIGALVTTVVVAGMVRHRPRTLALAGVAIACLAVMIVVHFVGLSPLASEVGGWTPQTMPANWPEYRNRWDWLQGARTALGVVALGAQLLSFIIDQATVAEQAQSPVVERLPEPSRAGA
jgi:hypothetical protein